MTIEMWDSISTAPKDGTRFLGRTSKPDPYRNYRMGYCKRITWFGKTSHVPLHGWCYGRVENVNLWEPTHWKPI